MLFSLHIENIAVIKSVDIDFSHGFSVLTGETGAGKSIILDSINLLLGKKADRELIRSGERFAMVSGLFGNLNEKTVFSLSSFGIDTDEEGYILVQRMIDIDGRSQIKINGRSVSISLLKAVASSLITIHGQTDNLALTESEKQLELIDLYAENTELLEKYRESYKKLCELKSEISELLEKESERERLIEILEYQIKDIDSVSPKEGEEEELIDKKLKIKNSEKINKNASFAFKALKGSEKGSVSFLLDKSASAISQIQDVVPEFSEYSEKLHEILYQVNDISEEIYAVISDMEDDPTAALNKIESRLDKISKLKRKYGLTVKDVLEFREKAENELDNLRNSENRIKALEKDEKSAYREALSIAERIHERRKSFAKTIEEKTKETLEFLDMPNVVFFASIKEEYKAGEKVLNKNGIDNVEFYISANKGEEARPLAKIASGGELARVMLALKSVVADKDSISTLIFDEIDSGVSGKTARKIGIKMLELSVATQIFSVTHSAQIASLADTHFLISKSENNGAVETSVRTLDYAGRIKELSRILGGIAVTEAQKNAAKDMLEERESYR